MFKIPNAHAQLSAEFGKAEPLTVSVDSFDSQSVSSLDYGDLMEKTQFISQVGYYVAFIIPFLVIYLTLFVIDKNAKRSTSQLQLLSYSIVFYLLYYFSGYVVQHIVISQFPGDWVVALLLQAIIGLVGLFTFSRLAFKDKYFTFVNLLKILFAYTLGFIFFSFLFGIFTMLILA